MYGPFLRTVANKSAIEIPPANNNIHNLEDIAKGNDPTNQDAVLFKQVELDILLSMNVDEGLSFCEAVEQTMLQSGNDYLFSFPCDRFPIPCIEVACVRLLNDEGVKGACIYLYQENPDDGIKIAEASSLGKEFSDFAQSFVGVMEQMRELLNTGKTH